VRCASEAAQNVRLAATTTAAFFTSASPANIAGLPSLIFAMSEGGAEKLTISGPHRLMEKYLSCVNTFVHRTYPRIELAPDDDFTSNDASLLKGLQPMDVFSSLSGPKYKPLQAGKDKHEAGLQIWRIASGFKKKSDYGNSKEGIVRESVAGGGGGGGRKRRRSRDDNLPSASNLSQVHSVVDENEVDLDTIDEKRDYNDENVTSCEVSSYSYIILISGRPKTIPGQTCAEHCAILIADFDTSSGYQLETVKMSLKQFIDTRTLPVPISLCLHLHDNKENKQNGGLIPSSQVLVNLFPDARHIFTLNGDALSRSLITPSLSSTRKILTHFPASVIQTNRLHKLDKEMFRNSSGGLLVSEITSSAPAYDKCSSGLHSYLLPLQVLPVFPAEGVFQKIDVDQPGTIGAGLINIESNHDHSCDSKVLPLPTLQEEDSHLSFTFLGTGAAAPSHRRSCSAILLSSPSFLLDCGEGALVKLLDVAVGTDASSTDSPTTLLHKYLLKIEGIFISHMHADHHTGLLTVLKKRLDAIRESLHKGEKHPKPLVILGPQALFQVLACYFLLFRLEDDESMNSFITFIPLQETRPGFPMWHRLQLESSPDAILWHCSVHHCRQSFGCALSIPTNASLEKRLVFLYSGDTRPTEELSHLAREASTGSSGQACSVSSCSLILIHEATFNDDRLEDAKKKRHSTVTEAFDVGNFIKKVLEEESSIKKATLSFLGIALTHFSQRYPSISAPISSSGKTTTDSSTSTSNIEDQAAIVMTQTRHGSSAFFAIDMMRLRPSDFEINESFDTRSKQVRVVINDSEYL